MGGGRFCMKVCQGENAEHYCEHIYDRIGIDFNCPTEPVVEGVFESCQGESQDYPGTYVQNGVTMTYTQPEGQISTMPYVARIPSSSNCQTFASSALFSGLPTPTGALASTATTTSTSGTSVATSRVLTGSGSPSNTGTGSTPAQTGAAVGFKTSGIAALSAIALAVAYAA